MPTHCTCPAVTLAITQRRIVHNCTHGEELTIRPECEDQMFELIFKYIDRLMAAARPRRLLYIAVDGVAPRAKMNQQRSRRFRAAKEMQQNDEIEERFRASLIARGQVANLNDDFHPKLRLNPILTLASTLNTSMIVFFALTIY